MIFLDTFNYTKIRINQLDMRYDDRNVIIKRVSTIVLELCLIWRPAQVLEKVIEIKTLAAPTIGFFVTLVDGWRSQTNATKSFILDAEIVLDTCYESIITIN